MIVTTDKVEKGNLNEVTKIDVWPMNVASHCHLWKNARDGGSLAYHKAKRRRQDSNLRGKIPEDF